MNLQRRFVKYGNAQPIIRASTHAIREPQSSREIGMNRLKDCLLILVSASRERAKVQLHRFGFDDGGAIDRHLYSKCELMR